MGSTVAEKIWDRHVVDRIGERDLLYVDLHLVHELSPQAFGGLEINDLPVRRPGQTLATMDHNVPTGDRAVPVGDPLARAQLEALKRNCDRHGIPLLGLGSPAQGIVHVIGPELGLTLPGLTVACGDSHTATHGALGALAIGVGTTQVEQILATQCLLLARPRQMAIEIEGELGCGVTAKDLALAVVGEVGFAGATGHVVEFRGSTVSRMSIEGRLTLCNMSAEMGARSAIIAPDDITSGYLSERFYAPKGEARQAARQAWAELYSDANASFDRTLRISAEHIAPTVTWGTTPSMSSPIDGHVPHPHETANPQQTERALSYMGLRGGQRICEVVIDRVFIGSCTNSRIEDLRAAAAVLSGRRIDSRVKAMAVPGSMQVKRQAESEGLDAIFRAAGFEWREPGCSMCLGMNEDVAQPGERVASTSNRNFEGRQGAGARTHLLSPAMAAAAALAGRLIDVREVA